MPGIKQLDYISILKALVVAAIAIGAFYITTEAKEAATKEVEKHDVKQEAHSEARKVHNDNEYAHPQMVEKLLEELKANQKTEADRIITALKKP